MIDLPGVSLGPTTPNPAEEPLGLEFYVLDATDERDLTDELESEGVGELESEAELEPADDAAREEAEIETPEGSAELFTSDQMDRSEAQHEQGSEQADPQGNAEHTPNQPAILVHPEDFWEEVVRLQQSMGEQTRSGGRALEQAVAWAAIKMSTHASGAATMVRSATATRSTQGMAGTPMSESLAESVASLEEQASTALVVAWEQRDSALHASRGARG